MKSANRLTSIIATIRTYCRQTADYRNPVDNELMAAYLKLHLSSPNWKVWQRLQPEQQAAFVYNQDALPTDRLSLQQFRLRLKQYKQAGYELFSFWHQAQKSEGLRGLIRVEESATN